MLGPLGAITFKDRGMFDDKLMLNEEYRYNGIKGGAAWKSKLERYFVSKAPALRELLEWAESLDNAEISEAKMVLATSARLTEEQAVSVNAQISGFLSGCLHGTADVMFKRAGWNNRVDAWRRLVRQVDHGRSIWLETLRREIHEIHTRPIKTLEAVEEALHSSRT